MTAKPRPVRTPRKAMAEPTAKPAPRDLGEWRGETLARMRALILEACPDVTEERKWVKPTSPLGVPVWSHHGIVCTGETYAHAVKLTFARGATLKDPSGLFNASLEGNTRRAIDLREGEEVNAAAFKALVKAAAALNAKNAKPVVRGNKPVARVAEPTATVAKPTARVAKPTARAAPPAKKGRAKKSEPVVLLSGGNPQIAKADGDAPVQAYIAGMPGWKRDLGERLDALVVSLVPNVRKAVKWNSPFYGVEGKGWFLAFHVFTRYIKVTFLNGTSLIPIPPGGTAKDARWIDLHEGEELDEAQLATWVKQAARKPGWFSGRPS